MSWTGIANNQCVSWNNLRDAVSTGVFTPVTSLFDIPSGNKQITKAQAAQYACLRTTAFPFASKASNQLVVKSDLHPCVTPVINTFRVNNTNSLPITISLSIQGVQVIPSQVCAANSATTLTPTVDTTGLTAALLEYSCTGWTAGSASLSIFPATYTPDSVGSIIQFSNVNLSAVQDVQLSINP